MHARLTGACAQHTRLVYMAPRRPEWVWSVYVVGNLRLCMYVGTCMYACKYACNLLPVYVAVSRCCTRL